jgi:general secretion pathway protein B
MSVILDALKKLDREKSSRRSGTSNIAIEILRPDLPHPGKRIPLYVAFAFLASIAMAAITYSLMLKGGFLSKPSPLLTMNPAGPNQQVALVPFSNEPVRDAREEISPALPKIQSHVKSKKPAASLVENQGDEKKINRNVSLKEADTAPEKTNLPSEHAANGSAATSPSLNISAIVWYEEPSKRFAMINSLIATEGSVIEGMKVEEIYPNRVRFLHNSQHLEISIK